MKVCSRIHSLPIFFFILFFLNVPAILYAQSTSNEGTEFWAVFPTHMPGGFTRDGVSTLFPAEYSVFITGRQASSGIVSAGSFSQKFDLPANSVVEIRVPRSQAYINDYEANRLLADRAIRILVDPGKPKVVVYGHIFAGNRSAASLILPKDALGQTYYSMNYEIGPASDGGQNYITLIAAEPDTRVFLKDNTGSDLVSGGILLENPGDVYEFTRPGDLTGVRVTVDPLTSACKKFAMFSGTTNSAITAPSGCSAPNISSDPLYQQSYPVGSWGRNYGFVPFSSRSPNGDNVRTKGSFFRILASEDDTHVTINGNPIQVLNAGEFYRPTQPFDQPAYISADKPVAVAQYALSESCAGGGVGDPDMVLLNPVEFNIKNITIYSSSKENISENYVNILISTSAASSFRINGDIPRGSFVPLPAAPEYSYLQLNLNQYSRQIFNLSADEGFNAIAYGFGTVESYAYSAGTNLASSQSVAAINPDTKSVIENTCVNMPFTARLTLTSPASGLSWQFEENGPFLDQAVTSVPVVRNGTTYYEYDFPGTRIYTTAGQKTIRVRVKYPSLGGCSISVQQIDLLFEVSDPPEAKFKAAVNLCTSEPVQFTDESISNGNDIDMWHWDFGDGNSSEERNPLHTYSAPGSYKVKLTIANATYCGAQSYEQDLVINSAPAAAFTHTSPGCDNESVSFTDMSSSATGKIAKWIWDFGDGTIVERTDPGNVSHRFAAGGSFEVALTITGESGCGSTFIQTLNNYTPELEAGPGLMILKGGSAAFDIRASGTNLRYEWSPATGLDRTDIKNPLASPLEDTWYTVTITSEEGCVLTDQVLVKVFDMPVFRNTFTPNGDGVNDTWEIDYLESYPDVSVSIYSRYGVRVYISAGYSNPWDGNLNGSPLPAGTYYYVIDPKMGLPIFKGWVTILR